MDWVELILGFIAEFKWPVLVIFVLWRSKSQLPELLARLRSFELPGGVKGTLAEPLSKLNVAVSSAEADVAELRAHEVAQDSTGDNLGLGEGEIPTVRRYSVDATGTATMGAISERSAGSREEDIYSVERRILDAAESSPEIGLMHLASEIEREVREIVASRGMQGVTADRPMTGRFAVRALAQQEALPASVVKSLDAFWNVRNLVVHGRRAAPPDVIQALDSGLTLLRSLKAIPREIYSVHEPRVDVFTDAEGTNRREDVWGVIIESRSPGGVMKSLRVLPTTRSYLKGKRVSWDWEGDIYNDSWYHSPDTGKIEHAWTSSMKFAGRHLDDIP